MKTFHKEVNCPICGKKHEYTFVMSAFRKNKTLDGRDDNYNSLMVQECPYCHYLTLDMEEQVSDATKEFSLSNEVNGKSELQKYVKAIKISQMEKREYDEFFFTKLAYWYCLDHGLSNKKQYLEKIVEYLDSETDTNMTWTNLLSYIDFMRQNQQFKEARELIIDLVRQWKKSNFNNEQLQKIIELEWVLVNNKDSNVHYMSEI